MGDMGNLFRAWNEEKKEKRMENGENSLILLKKHHVNVKILNPVNFHCRIHMQPRMFFSQAF